jgi:hypothetical protein
MKKKNPLGTRQRQNKTKWRRPITREESEATMGSQRATNRKLGSIG